jgi:hypothetical protein
MEKKEQAASNAILIPSLCPKCGRMSVKRFVCHVASAIEGDAEGPFSGRTYHFGEKMRWWSPADSRHADWRAGYPKAGSRANSATEACRGECRACGAQLQTLIHFQDLSAVEAGPYVLLTTKPDRAADHRSDTPAPSLPSAPAWNWIDLIGTCPVCRRQTILNTQCHVASDRQGDEHGSFHAERYRFGDRLRWWPENDVRYAAWRAGLPPAGSLEDSAVEDCPMDCRMCGAKIRGTVLFHQLAAIAVENVREPDDPLG